MSATPPATIPSSRCWGISASATTSRSRRSPTPGSWSPRISACPRTGCWSPSSPRTTTPPAIWRKVAGLPDEPDHPHPDLGQFLAHGRYRPVRPVLARSSTTTAPAIPGGPPGSPDEDGDRFVEIWNLVFMQFEEGPPGTRVAAAAALDRHRHGAGALRRDPAGQARQLRHRHAARADPGQRRGDRAGPGRPASGSATAWSPTICAAGAFLIADGVLPSNEGRGYVLRRIMRRAMRHAHMMGAREPLMHRLVPALVRQMGAAYPELVRAEALIIETLLLEETRFRQMLERGLHLLDRGDRHGSARASRCPATVAFRLYDTYGFPLDLTQDALREQGRDGGPRRLRGGDGRAARPRPRRLGRLRRGRDRAGLVRAEGEGRRHRVPRLLDRDGRGARSSRWW